MSKAFFYNKSKVRSDFAHVRELMRMADQMMREGITDYSEAGDAGQLALELAGCAAAFENYVVERRYAGK